MSESSSQNVWKSKKAAAILLTTASCYFNDIKVQLTSKMFLLLKRIHLLFEAPGRKKIIWLNPRFSLPFQSSAWSVSRPSFRESGATVADDVYPSTSIEHAWQLRLTAWNFESNLQYFKPDNGEVSFADELLRNGNLADAKWSSRKTKIRKENSRTALSQFDSNFVNKHKIPTLVYSPFTFVLSENVPYFVNVRSFY